MKQSKKVNKNTGRSIRGFEERVAEPNRTYKDRLFRMIFKEKKEFLELYNAINGTSYDRPEDLVITTLENAVYLGMKNDVSFLIYDELPLYEHQSTVNPNMPLRDLLYVADIYSELTRDENLYGTTIVKIPAPAFVVFYNGIDPMPEQMRLKLSDAFEKTMKHPNLELETLILNINPGYNLELMDRCRTLCDYMTFVSLIRRLNQTMSLNQAVEQAINTCIEEGILADFLRKNKAEVQKVSIYEYNEERHLRQERESAMEQGRYIELFATVQKMLQKGMSEKEISDMLEKPEFLIQKICRLTQENPGQNPEALSDLLKNQLPEWSAFLG